MAHIVVDARIRRSGTGRYVDQLLAHLQDLDSGNKYTVLLEPDDNWRPKSSNFGTVPSRFKQFSFNPIDQFAFPRQLKSLKPDLVHFAMTQQPLFYFGKAVTTTHDLTMFEYARAGRLPEWLHRLRMVLYRFLFWWANKKSAFIIVPSKYVAEGLAKYQPFTKNKIVVTYEAAGVPHDMSSKPIANLEKPFIFHVGSPFPHKNIHRLIDAFILLKAKHPNLTLVLAGKREYYFEKLIKWTASKRYKKDIAFVGRISDAQLKWLYENGEAYVLPSLSEGFGLPGLEAMTNDCALVASNATCLPEIYGNGAHYFSPESVENMAQAINDVISDPKLHSELIKHGRTQAAKYSWAKMSKETLGVYARVLQN